MNQIPGQRGPLPIIGGPKQIAITVSQLCAQCFPQPKPGIIIYEGKSLCGECFGAIRDAEKEANPTGQEINQEREGIDRGQAE